MTDNADDNVDLSENSSDKQRHNRKKSMSSERSSRKKRRRIRSISLREFSSSSSSSNEEQRSKKRKKIYKNEKSKKRCRTKSPTPENSRFRLVNKEYQFKWKLLDTMAKHVNDHLNIFKQKKDLKKSL